MVVTFPDLGRVGRLGNQLFQIASTIGIAERRGLEPRFPEWDYSSIFSLPQQMFGQSSELQINAVDCVPEIDERERVYLQSVELFDHMRDRIREYFAPSAEALDILSPNLETLAALPSPIVSLHVRRGDKLTHPEYHPIRSVEYYADALARMEKVGSVAIFSDDPAWCSMVLAPRLGIEAAFYGSGVVRSHDLNQYGLDGPIDWQDLFLMSRCDYHIISNSTYAWWGAYLSDDPHPYYPDNWFGRELPHAQSELLFPDNWIQVHDATQGGI